VDGRRFSIDDPLPSDSTLVISASGQGAGFVQSFARRAWIGLNGTGPEPSRDPRHHRRSEGGVAWRRSGGRGQSTSS
jgi:hypothetical protein